MLLSFRDQQAEKKHSDIIILSSWDRVCFQSVPLVFFCILFVVCIHVNPVCIMDWPGYINVLITYGSSVQIEELFWCIMGGM